MINTKNIPSAQVKDQYQISTKHTTKPLIQGNNKNRYSPTHRNRNFIMIDEQFYQIQNLDTSKVQSRQTMGTTNFLKSLLIYTIHTSQSSSSMSCVYVMLPMFQCESLINKFVRLRIENKWSLQMIYNFQSLHSLRVSTMHLVINMVKHWCCTQTNTNSGISIVAFITATTSPQRLIITCTKLGPLNTISG